MEIELIPVTSSQIAAIGYDPTTGELVIEFRAAGNRPARLYSYHDVPPDLATGLAKAESIGSYFCRHIRNGPYRYRRYDQARRARDVEA